MAGIADIRNPWRDRMFAPASFRGAAFNVESDMRASGRRIVPFEFPKRDTPYAEDMGRRMRRWNVTGYLIGPDYLTARDRLIAALEAEGPGALVLPFPYLSQPEQAVATHYGVTNSRERGGFCVVEMTFLEAGAPGFDLVGTSTRASVGAQAASLEALAQRRLQESSR